MEISERDKQILFHILKYCNEVEKTVERIKTEEEFNGDFMYRNAISMPLLQIGELANHFSEDFLKTYVDIPWRDIIAMRNRFAHGYGEMDLHEIWTTASTDVTNLKHSCRKILKSVS